MKTECAAPAPANQKELVRLLYLEHGYKRAAELANVEYDTVRQWAHRFGWNKQLSQLSQQTKQVVDNVQNELAENERKTKLSLSRYAQRAAQDSEQATLRDSGLVKQVAQTAAIVHRWDAKTDQSTNVIVNVALLGIQPAEVKAEAITVEPDTLT